MINLIEDAKEMFKAAFHPKPDDEGLVQASAVFGIFILFCLVVLCICAIPEIYGVLKSIKVK